MKTKSGTETVQDAKNVAVNEFLHGALIFAVVLADRYKDVANRTPMMSHAPGGAARVGLGLWAPENVIKAGASRPAAVRRCYSFRMRFGRLVYPGLGIGLFMAFIPFRLPWTTSIPDILHDFDERKDVERCVGQASAPMILGEIVDSDDGTAGDPPLIEIRVDEVLYGHVDMTRDHRVFVQFECTN